MRKTYLGMIGAMVLLAGCKNAVEVTADYNIIPRPLEVSAVDPDAAFKLDDKTVIYIAEDNDSLRLYAGFLADYVESLTGNRPAIVDKDPGSNLIILDCGREGSNPEGYNLTVKPESISIDGVTAAGTFYGIQTLRKSIPAKHDLSNVLFPAVTINDQPRFAYRGAMLDVARHFFPEDSVKSFIDMLALHNINRMHWHLTDDQGWRVEIKGYPRLTEIGSNRPGTVIGHNSGRYDSIPVSGYYTQEQIRDVVKYAADRNITIIPEIDLPGHMVAALSAYPEYGCTGGPYEVWQQWGVSEDLLCAGNDSTLKFLDDVLNEVAELFPSTLFHIGGDECPKLRWEQCPKCQARIRELGLKTDGHSTKEQKLQSYVMEHAAKTLANHGKRIIGWDEILEGGMSKDAVIMSWRGEDGGIEGARAGHDVIMTPNSHCYFDYYQTLDKKDEPDAIGGYIPVEKTYSYEPLPAVLTPEEQQRIKGVQANLWTEYIPTFSQVQYMELPRMAALSEVQWSAPEHKDYNDFAHRLPQMLRHYDANGYNYAKHVFDVTKKLDLDSIDHTIVATFTTIDDSPVYYTLDGSEPTEASNLYESPLKLDRTCIIKAVAMRDGKPSRVALDSVSFNKATARPVVLLEDPANRYKADGPMTLTDGRFGAPAYNAGGWVGFVGKDLVAVVTLGDQTEVSEVGFNACVETGDWIFDAREIKVALSDDGKTWREVASESLPELTETKSEIVSHILKFPTQKTKYVKLTAVSQHAIPQWHVGKGKPGFLFVDEIIVN